MLNAQRSVAQWLRVDIELWNKFYSRYQFDLAACNRSKLEEYGLDSVQ